MLEIYSNMKTFKHIARVNMVYNMILHRIDSVSMVYMLYNPFGLLIIKLKNKLQSDYKININDNWIVNTNKYNKKITNIVIPVQLFSNCRLFGGHPYQSVFGIYWWYFLLIRIIIHHTKFDTGIKCEFSFKLIKRKEFV